jgi:hypothetical protein
MTLRLWEVYMTKGDDATLGSMQFFLKGLGARPEGLTNVIIHAN